MVDETFKSKVEVEGVDQTTEQFNKMGEAGEAAFNKVGAAADKNSSNVDAMGKSVQQAASNMGQAGTSASSFADKLREVNNSVTTIISDTRQVVQNLTLLGAGFTAVVGAIQGFVVATADSIAAIENQAAALNISSSAFETYRNAALLAGLSTQQFQRGFTTFTQQIQTQARESAKALLTIVEAARKFKDEPGVFRAGQDKGGSGIFQLFPPDMKRNVDEMIKALDEMAERLSGRVPGLSKFRALEELRALTKQGAEGFKTLERAAAELGVTLPKSLDPLNTLRQAAEGADDAFRDLGVALLDSSFKMREPEAIFDDLVQKFSAMEEGQRRAALGARLFGKSIGDQLITAVKEAQSELEELAEEVGVEFSGAVEKAATSTTKLDEMMKQLSLKTTPQQKERMVEVSAAYSLLSLAATSARNTIADVFAPSVSESLRGQAVLILQSEQAFKKFAETVRDGVMPIVRDVFALLRGESDDKVENKFLLSLRDSFVQALGIIRAAAVGIFTIIDQVVQAFNRVFGTNVTTQGVIIAGIILQVVGAFRLLNSVLGLVGAAFTVFNPLVLAAGVALAALALAFGTTGEQGNLLARVLEKLGVDTTSLGQTLREGITKAIVALPDAFKIIVSALKGLWEALKFTSGLIKSAFGVDVTPEALAAVAVVASMTGAFHSLAGVLVSVAASLTIVAKLAGGASIALGAIAGVIGWPATLAIGLTLVIRYFDEFVSVARTVAGTLDGLFGTTLFTGVVEFIALLGQATRALIEFVLQATKLREVLSFVLAPILVPLGHIRDILTKMGIEGDETTQRMRVLSETLKEASKSGDFKKMVADLQNLDQKVQEGQQTAAKGATDRRRDIDDLRARVKSAMAEVAAEFGKVGGASGQASNQLAQNFETAGQRASTAITKVAPGVTSIGDAFKRTGEDVKRVDVSLKDAGSQAKKTADDITTLLGGDKFKRLGDSIRAAFGLDDTLKKAADSVGLFVGEVAKIIDSVVTAAWRKAFEIAPDTVTNIETVLRSIGQQIDELIAQPIAQALSQLDQILGRLPPSGRAPAPQDANEPPLFRRASFTPLGGGLDDGVGDITDGGGVGADAASMTALTAATNVANAALTAFKAIVDGVGVSLTALAAGFGVSLPLLDQLSASLVATAENATSARAVLDGFADGFTQSMALAVNTVGALLEGLVQQIGQKLMEVGSTVESGMQQMASSVNSAIDSIITKLNEAIAKAQELASAVASSGGGSGGGSSGGGSGFGGGISEFAGGGQVGGAGGVDTNLVRATRGEWIINPDMSRKWHAVLKAINENKFRLPRFNTGGIVGGLENFLGRMNIPRFANGGLIEGDVGSMTRIALELDRSTTVQLLGRQDAVQQIAAAAVKHRSNRIGKRLRGGN